MITLVCNAAEGALDIVLGNAQGMLCAQTWQAPTRCTEILVPALHDMLCRLGLRPKDVGRMACVCGPGSFTGLRLTLTTAAALRRTCGLTLAGLDYMQAVALRGWRTCRPAGQIWVLTHARRDLVHCQVFAQTPGGDIPQSLAPVDLLTPTVAARRMGAAPPGSLMLGSGVTRNRATLTMEWTTALMVGEETQPQPADLWTLAQAATYAHADIEPLYVRPCDAVDILSTAAQAQLEARLREPMVIPSIHKDNDHAGHP